MYAVSTHQQLLRVTINICDVICDEMSQIVCQQADGRCMHLYTCSSPNSAKVPQVGAGEGDGGGRGRVATLRRWGLAVGKLQLPNPQNGTHSLCDLLNVWAICPVAAAST